MCQHTDIFNNLRGRLFTVAYQMLGSRAESEDVLQDAFLRWQSAPVPELRSNEAWLTTVVKRLSIDRLRHAQVRREAYIGPWLPEPLAEADFETPEAVAELQSDISIAFLAVLESLTPDERAVFLLREVLDDEYADIAELIGKSEAACRQLAKRARDRLQHRHKRYAIDAESRTRVLRQFIDSANSGDRRRLLEVLAADATMVSDGGGKAPAVLRPLRGAERIAWLWYAVARRSGYRVARRIVRVNGEPGLAVLFCGRLHSVAAIDTDGQRVHGYYSIANPEKLQHFARSMSVPLLKAPPPWAGHL